MARRHFQQAKVDQTVTIVEGNAHDEVSQLPDPIDVLFLDADKIGYEDYLRQLLPLVRPGGLILADNLSLVPRYRREGDGLPRHGDGFSRRARDHSEEAVRRQSRRSSGAGRELRSRGVYSCREFPDDVDHATGRFPVTSTGMESTSSIRRGILNSASRRRQWATMSRRESSHPDRTAMMAAGISPCRSSGTPRTTQSRTSGISRRTSSISAGATFMPPRLRIDLERPQRINSPEASILPRSPVSKNPCWKDSRSESGWSRYPAMTPGPRTVT